MIKVQIVVEHPHGAISIVETAPITVGNDGAAIKHLNAATERARLRVERAIKAKEDT